MHESVLLKESIEYLNLKPTDIVVDCTLGYAGHSSQILKRIPEGKLIAFDQDIKAITYSQSILDQINSNYEIIYSNFEHLKKQLEQRKINRVDKVLYDLGVSSPQLDEGQRGFSFHKDAKLDMRMDQNNPLTAHQVVNEYSKEQLIHIFHKYGEEKYASSIAQAIVKRRSQKLIETTMELTEIIKESVPEKYRREKHPARKVFQAIRIEVNNELEVFEKSLKQAIDLLNVNGRVCVITFHSLEDSLCKKVMKEYTTLDSNLKKLPMIPEKYQPKYKIVTTLDPSREEVEKNKRARSAKLRVIERIKE